MTQRLASPAADEVGWAERPVVPCRTIGTPHPQWMTTPMKEQPTIDDVSTRARRLGRASGKGGWQVVDSGGSGQRRLAAVT